jgi:transcriptional regulator with XRE-family HTH domain
MLSHVRQRNSLMTPRQCRAARSLLGWTQVRLAKAAGLGVSTVGDFEMGRREVSPEAFMAIRGALEADGIRFTNGRRPGVRLEALR